LIDEYGSAVAADFQAHYGLDLWDVVADLCSEHPAYTPRQVLALAEWLPDDGAVAACAAARPPASGGDPPLPVQHFGWGMNRHLLAAIFDAVAANTVVTARVAGAKKVPDPKPWPRPGKTVRSSSAGTPITALMPRRRKPTPGRQVPRAR
jgi:hypothetical protein